MGTELATGGARPSPPPARSVCACSSSPRRCCPSRRRPTRARSGSSPRSATSCTAAGTTSRSSAPATPRSRTSTSRPSTQSLWSTGYSGDVASYMQHTIEVAWREAHRFDIVHAHMENHAFVFAEHCETPVISTLHGRLDMAGMPELLEAHPASRWSRSARASAGGSPTRTGSRRSTTACRWTRCRSATEPGDYLAFVGPDHAREGHQGGDRAEPRDRDPAAGRGQGLLASPSRRTSTRSSSPRSTRTRSTSWARSGPRSATRCTRAPSRP